MKKEIKTNNTKQNDRNKKKKIRRHFRNEKKEQVRGKEKRDQEEKCRH